MPGPIFAPPPVGSGELPLFDGPPDLRIGPDGDYQSTGVTPDSTWSTGELRDETNLVRDLEDGDPEHTVFRITEVVHNRFQIDKGPQTTFWVADRVVPPDTREVELGDGQCQTQERMIAREHTADVMIVKAWVERWAINEAQESYYDWMSGRTAAVGGASNAVAGIGAGYGLVSAGAGAGASVGEAFAAAAGSTVTAAAATGITVFLGTTKLMEKFSGSADLISAGWAAVGKFHANAQPTGTEESRWVDSGDPHPCKKKRPVTGTTPPTKKRVLVPSGIWWFLPIFGLLALGGVGFWLLGSDSGPDEGGEGTILDDPAAPAEDAAPADGVEPLSDDPPEQSADPLPDPGTSDDLPEITVGKNPDAATVGLGPSCGRVTHQPPPSRPTSFSFFLLDVLVFGVEGPFPPGSTLQADVPGADTPFAAPVQNDIASGLVPISSYGTYMLENPVLTTPGGETLPVFGDPPTIVVTGAEGPTGGCTPIFDFTPDERAGAVEEGRATLALDATRDDLIGFVGQMSAAHEGGDVVFLFDTLDPLVGERYGPGQCRDYIGGIVGSVSGLEPLGATPEPWSYATDGLSAEVPGSWTVPVAGVFGGEQRDLDIHLHPTEDGVRWFTDCGDPLATQ